MKNEIVLFENQDVKLEVNMKDETVWLSLEQMTKLFDRDKSVISRHIKNALEEELDNSVVANFATTAKDGKTYQVDYYNLDMIISVGYRVKSKNGIIFRKWANKIIKDYLIKGLYRQKNNISPYNEDEYNKIKTEGLTNFVENGNGFLSQGGKVEVNVPIENLDDILAIGDAWGDVVIADGLADLESKLGIDIKIDDVHGKTDGKMVCLIGAAYVYSTTGGVEVYENINLVKTDGSIVDNVYVVGNDSLGCLNESNKAYVTYGGAAQGWALTSGRLSGANAANK